MWWFSYHFTIGFNVELVTLINRSSKTLEGTWDGRHYPLAPGKHSFPRIQAEKFRDQNPIMGSEDRYSLQKKYLIGIEEDKDDCSPIEQSNAISLANLQDRIDSGELRVIKGEGLYSPARDSSPPLPANTDFVKP